MSVPNSETFYFEDGTITKLDYKDTEHYKLTKMIMDNPDSIMDILGSDESWKIGFISQMTYEI